MKVFQSVLVRASGTCTAVVFLFGALSLSACSSDGNERDPEGQDGSGDDTMSADGGAGGGPGLTYCDVRDIIEVKCLRCHTAEPQYGAPMPLVTYEELYEERFRALHAIEEDFMPDLWTTIEPEAETLTEAEKHDLVEWLESGAPDCP